VPSTLSGAEFLRLLFGAAEQDGCLAVLVGKVRFDDEIRPWLRDISEALKDAGEEGFPVRVLKEDFEVAVRELDAEGYLSLNNGWANLHLPLAEVTEALSARSDGERRLLHLLVTQRPSPFDRRRRH
jgi:hypothetical protein